MKLTVHQLRYMHKVCDCCNEELKVSLTLYKLIYNYVHGTIISMLDNLLDGYLTMCDCVDNNINVCHSLLKIMVIIGVQIKFFGIIVTSCAGRLAINNYYHDNYYLLHHNWNQEDPVHHSMLQDPVNISDSVYATVYFYSCPYTEI